MLHIIDILIDSLTDQWEYSGWVLLEPFLSTPIQHLALGLLSDKNRFSLIKSHVMEGGTLITLQWKMWIHTLSPVTFRLAGCPVVLSIYDSSALSVVTICGIIHHSLQIWNGFLLECFTFIGEQRFSMSFVGGSVSIWNMTIHMKQLGIVGIEFILDNSAQSTHLFLSRHSGPFAPVRVRMTR